jgi:hypothetical protein
MMRKANAHQKRNEIQPQHLKKIVENHLFLFIYFKKKEIGGRID